VRGWAEKRGKEVESEDVNEYGKERENERERGRREREGRKDQA